MKLMKCNDVGVRGGAMVVSTMETRRAVELAALGLARFVKAGFVMQH